jgi:hypothetical protein
VTAGGEGEGVMVLTNFTTELSCELDVFWACLKCVFLSRAGRSVGPLAVVSTLIECQRPSLLA